MATDGLSAADPPDPLGVAHERLGDPEATFRVGAGRFWAKLATGLLLVAYGVAANVLAWQFGVWGLDHAKVLVLFVPPLTGLSILRHLYVSRGLAFDVYPSGLLRAQGRELRAFPWAELTELTVRAEQATPLVTRDGSGRVVDCRLVVTSPVFRLASAGVTLKRADGETLEVTPAVAGYSELVEEVTSRSFAEAWPRLLADLAAGGSRTFGPWVATAEGLRPEGKHELLPWGRLKLGPIADKQFAVDHAGAAPGRWAASLEGISYPHLLVALLATE